MSPSVLLFIKAMTLGEIHHCEKHCSLNEQRLVEANLDASRMSLDLAAKAAEA